MVEIQLTESLQCDDQEFVQYVPFLYEISYKLMFRLYCRHRDQTPSEDGSAPRCPEIDFTSYTPTTAEQDHKVSHAFVKIFVTELFVNKTRMSRKNLEDKLTNQIFNWLQPHHIRLKAYDKFESSSA